MIRRGIGKLDTWCYRMSMYLLSYAKNVTIMVKFSVFHLLGYEFLAYRLESFLRAYGIVQGRLW